MVAVNYSLLCLECDEYVHLGKYCERPASGPDKRPAFTLLVDAAEANNMPVVRDATIILGHFLVRHSMHSLYVLPDYIWEPFTNDKFDPIGIFPGDGNWIARMYAEHPAAVLKPFEQMPQFVSVLKKLAIKSGHTFSWVEETFPGVRMESGS